MAIFITGASAGFGQAMCKSFIQAGYQVIGAARRLERLQEMQTELGERFYPLQMDLTDTASIDAALQSLPAEFAEIDCLINNGGLALGLDAAPQADFNDWYTMIQTNIIGLSYLTRQVLPQMVERNRGYIINIGSIAGTYPYPGGNVYGATKAYVRQFSLNLRADLHLRSRLQGPAPHAVGPRRAHLHQAGGRREERLRGGPAHGGRRRGRDRAGLRRGHERGCDQGAVRQHHRYPPDHGRGVRDAPSA